jgi:hypothetical protein
MAANHPYLGSTVTIVAASMATAIFSGDGETVIHSLLLASYAKTVLDTKGQRT